MSDDKRQYKIGEQVEVTKQACKRESHPTVIWHSFDLAEPFRGVVVGATYRRNGRLRWLGCGDGNVFEPDSGPATLYWLVRRGYLNKPVLVPADGLRPVARNVVVIGAPPAIPWRHQAH